MLTKKIEKAQSKEEQDKLKAQEKKAKKKSTKKEPSTLEKISKNTMVRQIGRTFFREVTRGILGILGVKK